MNVRRFSLALVFLPLLASAAASKPASSPQPRTGENSVVRVNSTNQSYDFFRPWMKKSPFTRRGLGAVIEGGRVLVTAELVGNHSYVELEKARSAEKAPAVVERVDYECNLAVLKPVDPAFLKELVPLELDSGAKVGDRASVLQVEPNGDIAETPGTLTSITIGAYPGDGMGLLIFRLSAPLQQRDGSFTLPAMRDGRLLGLLMRYDARSQVAEIIPPPVIRHFLKEHAKPVYGGFARAGLGFASTRDPQLRRYLGLQEPGGVYVTDILSDSSAEKSGLKKGDVILSVDGKPIDQDGNYDDPEFGRIPFSHLTNTVAHPGDTVVFRVLREGKTLDLPVKLEVRDRSKMLSEPFVMDRAPRYINLGGLVFLELSRPYLQEWGGSWPKEAPQRLVYYDTFQNEIPRERGKIVFLSQVLPSPDTIGYEQLENIVVKRVNGRDIRSLDDLAEAVKTPVDGFHRIEFEEDPYLIFLDAGSVERNSKALQEQYALPALQRL